MTNEELDEACALAAGIYPLAEGDSGELIAPNGKGGAYQYHPTSDTVEGKAQCFDLMVKYKLWVEFNRNTVAYQINHTWTKVKPMPLQRAVCEAVVLIGEAGP